jgi:hypothetical protein
MAEALKNTTIFDRDTAVSQIQPMLEKLTTGADVVAFSPTSGSQIYTWLKRELKGHETLRFPADLRGAIKQASSDPIVFVDDNAASGVQARAQFLQIMGVDRGEWPNECRDELDLFSELTASELKALKERQIYLYVCAGSPSANAAITKCVKKHGLRSFRGLRYAKRIDRPYRWPKPLKRFLEEVGQSLIAWTQFGTSFEKLSSSKKSQCRNRALGYANVGALVTTNNSVPTSTITALWCPGIHRGQPWFPLLLRSGKMSYVVVS